MASSADIVIPFTFRFVGGPLPSPGELGTHGATRRTTQTGYPLVGLCYRAPDGIQIGKALGLVDLCERYETIELWLEPGPNDQLLLVWLLDYLRPYPEIVARLSLMPRGSICPGRTSEGLARWAVPDVDITGRISRCCFAWKSYGNDAQAWFDVAGNDFSVLPKLRRALVELLEELPPQRQVLAQPKCDCSSFCPPYTRSPNSLFYLRGFGYPRIFASCEIGLLLEGLAHSPDQPYPVLRRTAYKCSGKTTGTVTPHTYAADYH